MLRKALLFWTICALVGSMIVAGMAYGLTNSQAATANLMVALSDAPDPVVAGGNLTYTAAVANNGPGARRTSP